MADQTRPTTPRKPAEPSFRLPSKRRIKKTLKETFGEIIELRGEMPRYEVAALSALPQRIVGTGALHAVLDLECTAYRIARMLKDALQECGRDYPGAAKLYAGYAQQIITSFFDLKSGHICEEAKVIFDREFAPLFR